MISITRAVGTLFTTAALALAFAPAAGATTSVAHDQSASTITMLPSRGGGSGGSGGGHGGGSHGSTGHGGGKRYGTDAAPFNANSGCDGACVVPERHPDRQHHSVESHYGSHGCADPYNYDSGYYGCNQPQD
jgi:hypothetical protein